MLTSSGLWSIENQTRYSTEGLVALFNAVENFIAKHSGEAVKSQTVAEVGVVRFRDYSPAVRSSTVTRWHMGERVTVERVNYVRTPASGCYRDRVVGLMMPTKLYTSPLEALAAVGENGVESAPITFSRAIVEEVIRYCYQSTPNLWGRFAEVPVERVQVTAKRASKKGKVSVRGVMLRQAADVVSCSQRELGQATNGLQEVRKGVDSMKGALAKVNMRLSFSEDDVTRVIAEVVKLMDILDETSQRIREEQV